MIIKCQYISGYSEAIEIEVESITILLFNGLPYLELKNPQGETFPCTWLDYNSGIMEAGCYENF